MKTDWIWRKGLLMGALGAMLFGCGVGGGELVVDDGGPIEEGATTEPLTWVAHSAVERQSIGNCWIYAGASWLESLNKGATGQELNSSQSYTTYWHWFEQIANRGVTEISTGGSYAVVIELYSRYGVMTQGQFIAEEATEEMSARQKTALDAINASLSTGALSTPEARANRTTVRAELDKAWGLSTNVTGLLNRVFGAGVTRTLDKSYANRTPPSYATSSGERLKVLRPKDVPARAKDTTSGEWKNVTLADAIGQGSAYNRSGPYAWKSAHYPWSSTSRRQFQKRVQKALHDHQPVVLSWFVDFNAMGRDGTFTLEELARRGGPGRQGGHMVVAHDYEVDNVPGYGTLKAGVDETRPEALTAALDDQATLKFLRIKNSWGAYRPDRWDTAPLPGYHDLYLTYLNGPIKECEEVDGHTDPTNCPSDINPWWDAVLPAGY